MTVPLWMLEAVAAPQLGFLGALIGAVAGPLLGGIFKKKEQKSAQKAADRSTAQQNAASRAEYLADEARHRAEYEADRANERNYARSESDRLYELSRKTLNVDQMEANTLARQAAASRGLNLNKLRAEAEAAGFNPASVLAAGGLSAYSTEVGYGKVGSGGVTSVSPGGGGGGYAGGGYQREFAPVLSSGSFIGEAVERGLDTYFNTPPATDNLADALRDAMNRRDAADVQAQSHIPPGGFGYDLTKAAPFKAATALGLPALAQGVGPGRPKANPANAARSDSVNVLHPSGRVVPLNAGIAERLGITAKDGKMPVMMAEDLAAVLGEIAGEGESLANVDLMRGVAFPDNGTETKRVINPAGSLSSAVKKYLGVTIRDGSVADDVYDWWMKQ